MINMNDNRMDLAFDVNQWKKKKKKNSNTGAGVNANSKADIMNFAGSGPLAELVWSPQTGLNIKFAENEQHISSVVPTPHHTSGEVVKSSICTGSQNQGAAADTLSANLSSKRKRISVRNETRSLESKETRFQNVFQSLFAPETITRIENKSIGSSGIAERCSQESLDYNLRNEVPKGMFKTIRRLRLSRTDIHKWMDSKSSVAELDGFFLRLRVTKPGGGAKGPKYYVACITGLQWEAPWKDFKQPIRVEVGGVECFVESQHISNCDFVEDELIAWWQKTLENQRIPVIKDLKSKLAVRRTLGV